VLVVEPTDEVRIVGVDDEKAHVQF
jgi:hypothetical protein